MNPFWQGLTMGLAYVAPIGLQNLFVIKTALTKSLRQSILTAFIIVFFDITLALACFCGVGVLMARLPILEMCILLIGSLVVIYIGVGLLRKEAACQTNTAIVSSLRQTIITACVVTWFNPQAIIDGTMMLGAFKATLTDQDSPIFLAGVMSASGLWFILLTILIACFKDKITPALFRGINIVCGTVIILYGLKLFWSFWRLFLF